MLAEGYDVRSISAVSTVDFTRGRPSYYDSNSFKFHLDGTGNYEGNVLVSMFDSNSAGFFTDITSSLFGAATFTQAKKGIYSLGQLYNAVRFNVTSIQATKAVNVSGAWS